MRAGRAIMLHHSLDGRVTATCRYQTAMGNSEEAALQVQAHLLQDDEEQTRNGTGPEEPGVT
jgi:hypothetical protein